MSPSDLLGSLAGVLRAVRFAGIFRRGGSPAGRLALGLGLFGLLGYAGGAGFSTIVGGCLTIAVFAFLGYSLYRAVRRFARG